ncbi:hypothetical protein MCG45_15900 [Clostridium perfringens]|uniref:hypothetical protein n=1 Tax=Clostridium perfringens TaxID=1502 RepID=UPI001F05F5B5|nr:hypothetical protein [Clostridium perfringens]MCH1964313.1 hypothetical protein [Clostridium perfringens]
MFLNQEDLKYCTIALREYIENIEEKQNALGKSCKEIKNELEVIKVAAKKSLEKIECELFGDMEDSEVQMEDNIVRNIESQLIKRFYFIDFVFRNVNLDLEKEEMTFTKDDKRVIVKFKIVDDVVEIKEVYNLLDVENPYIF